MRAVVILSSIALVGVVLGALVESTLPPAVLALLALAEARRTP